MVRTFSSLRSKLFCLALSAVSMGALASCAPEDQVVTGEDAWDELPQDLVSANGVGRKIEFQGYVLLPVGSSSSTITAAVSRQVRTLFGAAKSLSIGVSERYPIINTASFVRSTVSVVDPATGRTTGSMLRVQYTYRDRVVVPRTMENDSTFTTTIAFGNYQPYGAELARLCQHEAQDQGASTFWYHFDPSVSGCADAITTETDRVNTDRRALTTADRQVTTSEVSRRFLPIVVRLLPLANNEQASPEYHRLYEDGTLKVYSFFGLDKEDDAYDYGGRNYFLYLKTLTSRFPQLRVTEVSTGSSLLNIQWQGRTLSNVTYPRIISWFTTESDRPSEVPASDWTAFRLQVLRQWRDRYVTLGATGTVTINGRSQPLNVQIVTYYGDEEHAAAPRAVQRYIAAFRDADVFQYSGHSHLGFGPLDPGNYRSSNFPNKYQLIMVNSCASFSYYNHFARLHPGGTANLDTITNGLPVYLEQLGTSSAALVIGLIDGQFRGFLPILQSMRVDLPWEGAHDANRVADGELDNQFNTTTYRMSLSLTAAP